MLKINIDDTPFQEFSIPFEGELINIVLSFRLDSWFMDLDFKKKSVKGLKLSSSVLMLQGKNLPFDIFIDDKGLKLDPFHTDSFSKGLFDFLLVERDELTDLRGFEVE